MDKDIENFYGSCIMTSSFKGEFIREGQVIIAQVREPEGIDETSEEELKKLTDVLINGYGLSSFSISLASFGNLSFSFLITG
jgi:hypothetical protein